MQGHRESDPFAPIRESFRKPGFLEGFDLQGVLGSGGQGLVIRARKLSIGRTYAIKFLLPDGYPSRCPSSELQQIACLAELRHPVLVAILDRGELAGFPYLVMEFAGDRTLSRLLEEDDLSLETCLVHLTQVAEGLSYLHDHAILHLDIKPANIFVLGDHAKLGDYGLARLMDPSGPLLVSRPFGTMRYMAPELCEHRRASTATDVFGMGRVLEDVLTGPCLDHAPVPDHLHELIRRSTDPDPELRPPLTEFHQFSSSAPGPPRRVPPRVRILPAEPADAVTPARRPRVLRRG